MAVYQRGSGDPVECLLPQDSLGCARCSAGRRHCNRIDPTVAAELIPGGIG